MRRDLAVWSSAAMVWLGHVTTARALQEPTDDRAERVQCLSQGDGDRAHCPADTSGGVAVERFLGRGQRLARVAAGAVDQAAHEPFGIVEQDLENMFGGELLMPFPQRKGLGGLNETASAVGIFLDIHSASCPPPASVARWQPQIDSLCPMPAAGL